MVHVAVDAGPLHGPRTGIGHAVAWTIEALEQVDDLHLTPYVVSARAKLVASQRKLPLPAAAAHRLWARFDTPKMDRWLGRPDVVHGTNYVVPPTDAPRVVSVYDCWFLDHPSDAHPDVVRAAAVLRRSVATGAHVVTSSEATTDRVRELLGTDRVRTIHLGPPPPPPAPDSPAGTSAAGPPAALDTCGVTATDDGGAPFIVAIGTIERRKSLSTLVEAFGQLAAEHETVHLVIAGREGNDIDTVRRSLGRLDSAVRSRVHLLGAVDEATKHWLLQHAVALAYPSLDEGFGFPILEAQQAGTPVVASAAGSIPEVSGTGALLSVPRDAQALAVNLFGVVSSPQRRARLVDAGHANVERFSWETTATMLAEHYRELADGRSPSTKGTHP